MIIDTLTKCQRSILETLDAAPDKRATQRTLMRAAGLTNRGFRQVTARMERQSLIVMFCPDEWCTITFGGIQALRVAA